MQSISPSGIAHPPATPVAASLTPNASGTPQSIGTAFEGLFSSMLTKQMRQSLGGKTLFGADKSDALGGLFDHFMGQHLASHGGIGVGNMVRNQLESRSTTNVPQQSPRVPAAYTGAALPLHRTPEARSIPLHPRGSGA